MIHKGGRSCQRLSRLIPGLKAQLRRRSAIEPEIGYMKTDGRLSRCPLKGTSGDAIFAVLCGCGHNIRKILARLRALLTLLIAWIADVLGSSAALNARGPYLEMAA